MDDLSDELLALAGHKDVENTPQKKRLSNRKNITSQKRLRDKKYIESYKEPSKNNNSNDELYSSEYSIESENEISNDDDDLEEYSIPYVLEGKFKDEEDRKRIMSMNEIERESILYEREEETQKLQEKRELAERLKQKKLSLKKELKTRRSTRETKGETVSKRNKLTELKKKREEKSNKTTSKSDDQIFKKRNKYKLNKEYENDHNSENPENKEDNAILDLNDVNNTRLGRKHFAKFLFHPLFEGTIAGCFARVKIGENPQGKSVYRVCQVKGLQHTTKVYSFEGILSNQKLECIHGASTKAFEITFVSNSAITQKEFDRWTQQLKEDKIATPKKSLIEKKITELSLMTQHKLTELEISDMIARRKALQKIPGNIAVEKTQLKKNRDIAIAHGNEKEILRLTEKLNTLEELSEGRKHVLTHLDKLAKLNEKNRKANLDTIRQAELLANEERRKQGAFPVIANPFSRLKTNPKIFYDNILSNPQPPILSQTNNINENIQITEMHTEANEMNIKTKDPIPHTSNDIKPETAKITILNNIDEIIAQSDFKLDFDI